MALRFVSPSSPEVTRRARDVLVERRATEEVTVLDAGFERTRRRGDRAQAADGRGDAFDVVDLAELESSAGAEREAVRICDTTGTSGQRRASSRRSGVSGTRCRAGRRSCATRDGGRTGPMSEAADGDRRKFWYYLDNTERSGTAEIARGLRNGARPWQPVSTISAPIEVAEGLLDKGQRPEALTSKCSRSITQVP